ncbi:MAG: hypothetical protein IPK58_22260 [Acidobacteria bacterium]|nr:hypothetical protein [Acidobacteriota bacterium]
MNRTRIMPALTLIGLLLLIATVSPAQTQSENSVSDSQTIQRVPLTAPNTVVRDDELAIANQRLAKALDALDKAERVITALEAENAALRRLSAVNEQILTAKETVISEQIKLIEIYKKQSGRKISFLFGLVKIRY